MDEVIGSGIGFLASWRKKVLKAKVNFFLRHLEGEITIGRYAINPATQRCRWVAIDADYQDALIDLIKLGHFLRQDEVDSALEQSRRGGHLWVFMAEPLSARDCRIYVRDLALRLDIPIKQGRQREGIEIFPKHDALEPGRCGNAIRGPLGIHRVAAQRKVNTSPLED